MNKYQLVVLNQPRTCFSIKSKIFPFSPWLCIINSVTDTNLSLIKVRIILRFKKNKAKELHPASTATTATSPCLLILSGRLLQVMENLHQDMVQHHGTSDMSHGVWDLQRCRWFSWQD